MSRSNDPFFLVKSEVQKSISGVSLLNARLQELVPRAQDEAKDEFTWTLEELNTGVKSIEWDLQDLEETIKIASQPNSKFSITEEELSQRKEFIRQTRATIDQINNDIQRYNSIKSGNASRHARSNLDLDKKYDKYAALERAVQKENSNFVQQHMQIQKEQREVQDQGLEEISIRLDSIHNLSLDMNNEFTKQNKKLTEFGNEVDKTSSRVSKAITKADELLTKADNKAGYLIIAVLIFLLLILVVLIIFA